MRLLFVIASLLLGACSERQPPTAAAPVPASPTPMEGAGQPRERAPSPSTPAPKPPALCFFEDVFLAAPDTAEGDEPPFPWTPWLTDTCALAAFDFQAATPVPRDPEVPYADPVMLPNATGRRLFLVQDDEDYVSLLEREPTRFRACQVGRMPSGYHNTFGSVRFRLHHPPGTTLLELTNVYGAMGHGRGAMGSAMTYLQVYDLAQDRWLLNAPVGRYETSFGYTDEQGRNVSGQDQEVTRAYRVLDKGRTVVLGKYAIDQNPDLDVRGAATDSFPALPPYLLGSASAPPEAFPPGTYRLRAGKYQRVK